MLKRTRYGYPFWQQNLSLEVRHDDYGRHIYIRVPSKLRELYRPSDLVWLWVFGTKEQVRITRSGKINIPHKVLAGAKTGQRVSVKFSLFEPEIRI